PDRGTKWPSDPSRGMTGPPVYSTLHLRFGFVQARVRHCPWRSGEEGARVALRVERWEPRASAGVPGMPLPATTLAAVAARHPLLSSSLVPRPRLTCLLHPPPSARLEGLPPPAMET